ncbi:hypothetical protein HIM_10999 [Hirsutella minnesotensis 3608]|uniref:A to I editase domain-containing protein n=1 Tax=Hirsutella minnesotensis 3608 TaxID=1043627 RepID=A0A0F7ZFR7_9HYPO|nr:hypothetical protein HIM_10999 [Hirsutella minnesotensis 3608]
MPSRANRIARAVISQFNKLPPKRKPTVRDNGLHEWIPLSGIVAEENGRLTCLALATGMKCLPLTKLSQANGNGLHDWHAEILAIRTFNRFLLDECSSLTKGGDADVRVVEWARETAHGDGGDPSALSARRPFCIKKGVRLHMYCSEAPCGDASMELTMAAQEDASPWETPVQTQASSEAASSDVAADLPGRAYFSRLGIVRRKPARGDALPTASKSCSDKLALKQCTSLLSSLAALLVDPSRAYIDTLVLPASRHSAVACERSFSAAGRMAPLNGATWPGGYAFCPFTVETTTEVFEFSREAVAVRAERISACNIAAAWSASGVEESIIGGVLQGRKPFLERGASLMSRRRMWMAAADVANRLDGDFAELRDQMNRQTYSDVKAGPLLADRRAVKADARRLALTGWVSSQLDCDFKMGAE